MNNFILKIVHDSESRSGCLVSDIGVIILNF